MGVEPPWQGGVPPPEVVSGASPVDLCRSYGAAPGTDATTAIENALNDANAANRDTLLYFSKPGVYLIQGAQQTGAALGYAYTGQILVPARAAASGSITVTLAGCLAPARGWSSGIASETAAAGGVVLQTNAVAGKIIDAIPATNGFYPVTFVRLLLQDITIRSPDNPQLTAGVDGEAMLDLETNGSVVFDTVTPLGFNGPLTGNGVAIRFPGHNNAGQNHQRGDLMIEGWPTGAEHDEHFVADNLLIENCNVAVIPNAPQPGGGDGNPHSIRYNRLLIQGCATGFKPNTVGAYPFAVTGLVDIGDSVQRQTLVNLVDDPNNLMMGELTIHGYGVGDAAGFPVNGALNMRFRPVFGNGEDPTWPRDTFKRIVYGSYNHPGTTDRTNHTWRPDANFVGHQVTIAAGSLKAASGNVTESIFRYRKGRAQPSRVIHAALTTGPGAYNVWLEASHVISGANANNYIAIGLTGGKVTVTKVIGGANTILASSNAAVVAASTAYTVEVIISNPVGGTMTIQVLLNGTNILTTVVAGAGAIAGGIYSFSAAEAAQFVDTDPTGTEDGVGFFDTTSVVS